MDENQFKLQKNLSSRNQYQYTMLLIGMVRLNQSLNQASQKWNHEFLNNLKLNSLAKQQSINQSKEAQQQSSKI